MATGTKRKYEWHETKTQARKKRKKAKFALSVPNVVADAERDHPTNVESFPLDDEASWQWAAHQGAVGTVVRAGTRHISFPEFLAALREAAAVFVDLYGEEKGGYIIVVPSLGQPGINKCKSNYWVTELLLTQTVMREHPPRGVYQSAAIALRSLSRMDPEAPLPTVFVYPDDALFSGKQMQNVMANDWGNPPMERDLAHVIVLVPFATSEAVRALRLQWNTPTIFAQHIQPLRVFAQNLGVRGVFEHSAQAAVYFDHKMPDEVSRFPRELPEFIPKCLALPTRARFNCPPPPYKHSESCLEYQQSWKDALQQTILETATSTQGSS